MIDDHSCRQRRLFVHFLVQVFRQSIALRMHKRRSVAGTFIIHIYHPPFTVYTLTLATLAARGLEHHQIPPSFRNPRGEESAPYYAVLRTRRLMALNPGCFYLIFHMGPSIKYITLEGRGSEKV